MRGKSISDWSGEDTGVLHECSVLIPALPVEAFVCTSIIFRFVTFFNQTHPIFADMPQLMELLFTDGLKINSTLNMLHLSPYLNFSFSVVFELKVRVNV